MNILPELLGRQFEAIAVDDNDDGPGGNPDTDDHDQFSNISPSEVRKRAREHSEKIFKYWNILRGILERHEDRIRKRWMKKTREQRKKILLTAWPNMPSSHRPDYQAFREKELSSRRDAYLFPYINLEDLMQPKSLLIFLNTRGRHSPQMFSHADLEAIHFGIVYGAIDIPFLNLYTMYLTGTSPESYSRLVSWDDDPDAFDMMRTRRAFRPGDGLNILDCQERVIHFLVDCCKALLHDMGEDTLLGAASPIQAEPASLAADSNEWPTVAAMSQEAPYRLPALLDLDRLKAVLSARRSAAEDHVWALREDPRYFADTVRENFEHSLHTIPDTHGMPHPLMNELEMTTLWDNTLHITILESHASLLVWDIFDRQVTQLISLNNKYTHVISPDKDLPDDYMKALLSFKFALERLQIGPITFIKNKLAPPPGIHSQYALDLQQSENDKVCLIDITQQKGSSRVAKSQKEELDYMMWLCGILWDERQLSFHRLPHVMDELERLFQTNTEDTAKLSTYISHNYSELGIFALALHELSIYLPWAASMEDKFLKYQDVIKKECEPKFAPLTALRRYCKEFPISKLGAPTDDKFHYPSDKRRTQKNVDAMRKAEQNLDLFWKSVDLKYEKNAGVALQEASLWGFSHRRQIERTPEWIEPEKKSTKKPDSDTKHNSSPSFENSVLAGEHVLKLTLKTLKEKVNTRGTRSLGTPEQEQETLDGNLTVQNPDPQPKFIVSKKIAKVFSTMFDTFEEADRPGEIPWQDFLAAMLATDFAPVKLYGSVWQFTPLSNLGVESIQFHEPHSNQKIPFWTARRIGRRLNRAYGWHGGMFKLKGEV